MKQSDLIPPYLIVRSKRKTMSIQVKRDGQVIVRCPVWVADANVCDFVETQKEWIQKHYEKAKEQRNNRITFTQEQKEDYQKHARTVLEEKTEWWAQKMGVDYGKITIREQSTRWGSCSAKGNLNYNWKLILLPQELLEYVVVHELAHRREMNHSAGFWNIVEEELPDYQKLRRRLREHEDKIDS